jgi:tetratricopeptide (TPR) repeat protein
MTIRKTIGWLVFAALMIALAVQLPWIIARFYIDVGSRHLSSKRYPQAEKAFLKARSIKDESCASCGLGSAYHGLGREDDAEKAFKHALTLNPNDVCAYRESGIMYYDLHKYQEAIAAFKKVIALDPTASSYMFLGNSYVYADEYQAGVNAYKEAVRLSPYYARAHLQLGIAYDYLDRREEAVEEFKHALKLDPKDKRAHYSLAYAYVALRNKSEAQKEYKILREIDPENVAATFEEFAHFHESGKEKLYFVPLNNFSRASLNRLVTYYKQKPGIEAITTHPLPLRLAARDNRRQQLVAEELVEVIKRAYPELVADPNAIVIGLTDEDMYIRKKTWQYAFSYWADGRFAVVSSARMNPVNFGAPANADLLDSRMRKMVLKNIGVLYYQLPTNHNPKSVLYGNIMGVEDLDNMGEDF